MMGIKTGVQGWSMATWAKQQQQHRWVSHGTRYSLISTSCRVDRWAGGALSWSSQVELERDVELEQWVETVGISKGQDLCWFSQEYRVGETACVGGWVCMCFYIYEVLKSTGWRILEELLDCTFGNKFWSNSVNDSLGKFIDSSVCMCMCVWSVFWACCPPLCNTPGLTGVAGSVTEREGELTVHGLIFQTRNSWEKDPKKRKNLDVPKTKHAQTHPDRHTARVSGADGMTACSIHHPSASRLCVFSWQRKWSVHLCAWSSFS